MSQIFAKQTRGIENMRFGDFHTHTVNSDGGNTIAEMAAAAEELGFYALGITNHAPMPNESHYTSRQEWLAGIIREVEELRPKYEGRLELLAGIELDINTELDVSALDYIIEANHFPIAPDGARCVVDWGVDNVSKAVNEHFGGDIYSFIARYFEELSRAGDRGPATVGHFDLINIYNEDDCLFSTTDKRYLDAAFGAIDVLSKKDVIFEINTGALYRGQRTQPYPALPLLKYMKELGCRIILDSDSHSVEMLKGHRMLDALEHAKAAGYREDEIEKYPLLRKK